MRRSFSSLLCAAQANDQQAISALLEMYSPLIDRHSRIGNRCDEDLKQYLIEKTIGALPKFRFSCPINDDLNRY